MLHGFIAMKTQILFITLIVAAWPVQRLLAASYPEFREYSVPTTFKGKPKVPSVKTRHSLFRDTVRAAARRGPNFAGNFTIAEWRCGGYCISIAIVDSRKGKLYPGPFSILHDFGDSIYAGEEDGEAPDVQYQLDSRLLVVRGCPDGHDCATYYYEWNGKRFTLIRKVPAEVAGGDFSSDVVSVSEVLSRQGATKSSLHHSADDAERKEP